MDMDWKPHAAQLADAVTHRGSRWRGPVAATPRHVFVPRWWDSPDMDDWTLYDGSADEQEWARAAYGDQTLITAVGGVHADHAPPGDNPSGRPTSSSTLPSLALRMYRHGQLYDGADILDVGTGSGYGAALLTQRFGGEHVTSVDVDPYLTTAAAERLDQVGLHPRVETVDATGPLPGSYDRIVSMTSVRPIPESWLAALRPDGRLVTVIARTSLIVTAGKDTDGWAHGRVERDWAMFMPTRTGADYPSSPRVRELFAAAHEQDGDDVTHGRYPVLCVPYSWELTSMLEVTVPGIEHDFEEFDDDTRTAWMVHPDGSWARASAHGTEQPTVHQGGPRRLWDALDDIRDRWLREGQLPLYGAKVFIAPDGTLHLARGDWEATVT